jgi:predicted metal-dependent phosphoesterase TrpH
MKANLHLHSRYSDGVLWPSDVAQRAASVGLQMIALTDHDSMEGVPEFLDACGRLSLRGVAGIEIDCVAPEVSYRSELLAYFPAGCFDHTAAWARGMLADREQLMREWVGQAARLLARPDLRFEEILAYRLDGRTSGTALLSYARSDLYSYLQRKGAIAVSLTYDEFKKAWFRDDKLGTRDLHKPTLAQVVEMVARDGGKTVLPHPGNSFGTDIARMRDRQNGLGRLLRFCAEHGVWGVELYFYNRRTPAESEAMNAYVREQARDLRLAFTFGSDCHGPGSGADTIGRFDGDFDAF